VHHHVAANGDKQRHRENGQRSDPNHFLSHFQFLMLS
jgi:hypothetical protein